MLTEINEIKVPSLTRLINGLEKNTDDSWDKNHQ